MAENIKFIFIGQSDDFIFSKKYFDINSECVAIHITDEHSSRLSKDEWALHKNLDEIESNFDMNTLVVASSLYSAKDTIFAALEKSTALLLLNYSNISPNDYTTLQNYAVKSHIAFCVPLFASSKAILLKKMINTYTKTSSLNIAINDPCNEMFESDLFLLSLNLINKECIKEIEITKSSDNIIKIITENYSIKFITNKEKPSLITGKTHDSSWNFDWEIFGTLNSYHQNGIKESYSHTNENAIEYIYKNIKLNCLRATQIVYTTVLDFDLYHTIKKAFGECGDNSSIKISL